MDAYFNSRIEFVLSALQKSDPFHILDVGFIGEHKRSFIHEALLESFPASMITGIDMNEAVLTFNSTERLHYFQKSVFDLGLEENFRGKFDAVVFCEVFEHLQQPYKALHHLADALKPEGRLVMTWPNPLSATILIRYLRAGKVNDTEFLKSYLGANDHKVFPMPPCMVAYMKETGWRDLEISFIKGKLRRWPVLQKFCPYVGLTARK